MSQQEKYKAEYEQYKHILIECGLYSHKDKESIKVRINGIDQEKEIATLETVKTGVVTTKTLHWCRKYLKPFVPVNTGFMDTAMIDSKD